MKRAAHDRYRGPLCAACGGALQPPLTVDHRTMTPDRLRKRKFGGINRESIYLHEWRRRLKLWPQLLGLILAPSGGPRDPFTRQPFPAVVTQRDAEVAATVIQWLATNIGSAFVEECQAAVARAQQDAEKVGATRRRARETRDTLTTLERDRETLAAARKRLHQTTGGTR